MKTKILILALAAFCSFSSISASNCIDNLFNTASRMPNAEKVNLNSFVLGLLKPFSSELKGIKSMSIILIQSNFSILKTRSYLSSSFPARPSLKKVKK